VGCRPTLTCSSPPRPGPSQPPSSVPGKNIGPVVLRSGHRPAVSGPLGESSQVADGVPSGRAMPSGRRHTCPSRGANSKACTTSGGPQRLLATLPGWVCQRSRRYPDSVLSARRLRPSSRGSSGGPGRWARPPDSNDHESLNSPSEADMKPGTGKEQTQAHRTAPDEPDAPLSVLSTPRPVLNSTAANCGRRSG